MRRGVARYLVGSVVLAMLSGCGLFVAEQRAPWRDEAERACLSSRMVQPTAYVEPARGIDGPGACGMLQPFRISAVAGGSVSLSQKAVLACPIVPVIDAWIADVVQPAAQAYFGQPVVGLRAGSYSCRNVNNRQGGPLSEHAFGNAMDVMAFQFADGRVVAVKTGWGGAPEEQQFLREVLVRSCEHYTTVLGPGVEQHSDHFHLDLGRHSHGRHVCKPILKFTPRTGTGATAAPWALQAPAPVQDGPASGAPDFETGELD
jgi:hypothetical protein